VNHDITVRNVSLAFVDAHSLACISRSMLIDAHPVEVPPVVRTVCNLKMTAGGLFTLEAAKTAHPSGCEG